MKSLYYEKSGDNYKLKDPFKILALKGAMKTAKNISRFKKWGFKIKEVSKSRGESAFRIEITVKNRSSLQIAHVEEGVGTKNVVADDLVKKYGEKVYYSIAMDNAASVFNDLSTTGASPLSFMLHLAAYPTEWFSEKKRMQAIIDGTVKACNLAGAVWGGGESPTLRDIIKPGRSLFSGSATGIIYPSSKALSEEKLKVGDRIILLESSGVHTNGITLLRKELLKRLPDGYESKLGDGSSYGETLLIPSLIYSKLVEDLVYASELHYAVNITGHGWRKLMRAKKNLSYIIEKIPPSLPIFDLIKYHTNSSNKEMYGSYNMGAGFAFFVPKEEVSKVLQICKKNKIKGYDAGYVAKGKKYISIKPLGISFEEKDLMIK